MKGVMNRNPKQGESYSIILVIALMVIAGGAAFKYWLHMRHLEINFLSPFATSTIIFITPTPPPHTSEEFKWRKYRNEEVGIEFLYWGQSSNPNFNILNGDSGREFAGNFYLPSGALVQFAASTVDLSVGKGRIVPATEGYGRVGDTYYARERGKLTNVAIVPDEIWTLADESHALVFFGKNFDPTLAYPDLPVWITVNIPNSIFSGIGFELVYPGGDSLHRPTPEEIATLKQVITSIKFLKGQR